MSMPDWKNEEDYAFTANLSGEGWAWEFLRRNPEYKNDYAYVVDLTALEVEKFGPPIKYGVARKEDLPHTRFYEPERLPGETRAEWINRTFDLDKDPQEYSASHWHAKKWGIDGFMANPSDDHPPRFFPFRTAPAVVRWDDLKDYFEGDGECQKQKPGVLVLAFDLDLPPTPQVEATTAMLSTATENRKKEKAAKKAAAKADAQADANGVDPNTGQDETVQKSKLKQYLRVLDAKAAGASNSEIAAVLLPHEFNDAASGYHATKKIYDVNKAARRVLESHQLCLRIES